MIEKSQRSSTTLFNVKKSPIQPSQTAGRLEVPRGLNPQPCFFRTVPKTVQSLPDLNKRTSTSLTIINKQILQKKLLYFQFRTLSPRMLGEVSNLGYLEGVLGSCNVIRLLEIREY